MKKLKSFIEYSKIYENSPYYDKDKDYNYERDGGQNYVAEKEPTKKLLKVNDENPIINVLAEKATKIVEVLLKFGSITNEDELHSKVSETINQMYQTYTDPNEKEALNAYRNNIINKVFELLQEKGLNFDISNPY